MRILIMHINVVPVVVVLYMIISYICTIVAIPCIEFGYVDV